MKAIPKTQRAAVYYRNADVRIEQRPVPGTGHPLGLKPATSLDAAPRHVILRHAFVEEIPE